MLLDKFRLPWVRFQGQSHFRVIQAQIRQHSTVSCQWLNIPSGQQITVVLFVDIDAVLPRFAVILSACISIQKPLAKFGPISRGDVYRTRALLNELKTFRNGFKGEQAALKSFPQGFYNLIFVRLLSNQRPQ